MNNFPNPSPNNASNAKSTQRTASISLLSIFMAVFLSILGLQWYKAFERFETWIDDPEHRLPNIRQLKHS